MGGNGGEGDGTEADGNGDAGRGARRVWGHWGGGNGVGALGLWAMAGGTLG